MESFRVATELFNTGRVPDSVIQLMLRWQTPESLREYANFGQTQYASFLRMAQSTNDFTVRGHNLPAFDPDQHLANLRDMARHV